VIVRIEEVAAVSRHCIHPWGEMAGMKRPQKYPQVLSARVPIDDFLALARPGLVQPNPRSPSSGSANATSAVKEALTEAETVRRIPT
jgi:hypothetical protein